MKRGQPSELLNQGNEVVLKLLALGEEETKALTKEDTRLLLNLCEEQVKLAWELVLLERRWEQEGIETKTLEGGASLRKNLKTLREVNKTNQLFIDRLLSQTKKILDFLSPSTYSSRGNEGNRAVEAEHFLLNTQA